MLLGLRTVIYRAPDLAAGKQWYTKFDGVYARLLELGATPRSEIADVGEGIRIADLLDPFGNVLGIIDNPNFKPAEIK